MAEPPLHQLPPQEPSDPPRVHVGTGIQAFRSAGLLYPLNAYLHTRGVELRVEGDEVYLYGDGSTPRQFEATPDQLDGVWRELEQMIIEAKRYNRPGYWDGHSPGFGQNAGGPQP